MRKTTLLVVFLILASMLLFTSCKPLGRAVLPAVNPSDMMGFPRNVVKIDDTAKEIQVNIYATAAYVDAATDLLTLIQTDICSQIQSYNADCHQLSHNQIKNKLVGGTRIGDNTKYEISPKIVQSETTSFIAIGTCGNNYIKDLLHENTCQEMFEHKALMQYVDNNQLVIAGGTIEDIYAAIAVSEQNNLKGYYTDIINTDNIIASSSITTDNEIIYTETFMFQPGMNKIMNTLSIPSNMQSIATFFAGNLDKINSIYHYDAALPEKYQVYNAVPSANPAPSNLNHFAKTGETYIVDAKEAFTISIPNARNPDVTSLTTAGVWGVGVQQASSTTLASSGVHGAGVNLATAAVVNAFITGHSVADVTGAATAGMYMCSPPDAHPNAQRMCGDTEVHMGQDDRNSKDYYKFGEVSGIRDGTVFSFPDECIDSNTLKEWYCSDDCTAMSETYTCPSGYYCDEGKCLQGTAPSASTDIKPCDFETDDGNDPYKPGTVSYQGSVIAADDCENNGKNLKEYYCENGVLKEKEYPAYAYPITQCQNNALNARPIWQCTESSKDNPNSFVAFDPNRCGGAPFGVIYTMQATDNLVPIYNCNQEYSRSHKSSLGHVKRWYYYDSFLSLDSGCEGKNSDGLLGYLPQNEITGTTKPMYRFWMGGIPAFNHILSPTTSITGTEGPAEATFHFISPCIESDADATVPQFEKGTLTAIGAGGTLYEKEDTCQNANELTEYACDFTDNKNYDETEVQCTAGCSDGACVESTDLTITQLTTQNAKLVYRCYNPNTGDHSVSPCTGAYNQEGALGIIYTTQEYVANTYPIRLCKTGTDQFLSTDLYCEQQDDLGFYGRVFNEMQGTDTVPVYRCYNGEDHMLSLDEECEGWGTSAVEATHYFVKADIPIEEPTPTPQDCGDGVVQAPEECDDAKTPDPTVDCTQAEYDQWFDSCTAGSCQNCECKGALDCSGATCGIGSADYCTHCTHCGDGFVNCGEQCDPPNGMTCDANCMTIGGGTITPGVPPLVPPPTLPPGLPPLPHQFYGMVNNGTLNMPIQAVNQMMPHFTVVDNQGLYGYAPLFFVTGTVNGTIISWYVNNTFDQNFTSFQQGGLTRLDLTYQITGAAPPTGPTCSDGILNQNETSTDCGGPNCGRCANGLNCSRNSDCRSNYCKNGVCKRRPLPAGGGGGGGGGGRGLWSAAEQFYATQQPVDIPAGAECFDDWICDPWGPCIDGTQTRECFLNDYEECTIQLEKPITQQSCEMPEPEYIPPAEPTCFDGIKNQDETFRDCGGSRCKPCDPGLPCVIDRDCVTGYCDTITQTCGYPPPPVEEIPKPTSLWWVWLIIFLVALGGIGGIIAAIVLKHKAAAGLPNHRLEGLREYVDKFRKKGVPEEKIKKKVESAGWKQEDIAKVFK